MGEPVCGLKKQKATGLKRLLAFDVLIEYPAPAEPMPAR